MQMKRALIATVCTAVLCLAAVPARAAATIEEIVVLTGETASATVTVTFSDNCSRDVAPLTTRLEDMTMLQLFAGDAEGDCDNGTVTVTASLGAPAETAEPWRILVLLYSGRDLAKDITLLDAAETYVEPGDTGDPDECQERYQECLDGCLLEEEACQADCGDDDTLCLDECGDVSRECADNCTDALEDCLDGETSETAVLDIRPDTLNVKSGGRWITASLTGVAPASVDCASLRLQETIEPEWCAAGLDSLLVKFSRLDVVDHILETGAELPADIELTLTGVCAGAEDAGFAASDTVRVISPGRGNGSLGENDSDDETDTDDGNGNGRGNR